MPDVLHTLAAATGNAGSMSLLDYILAGREIGLVIILLSFVALGLVVAALIRLRLSRLAPPETIDELDRMLRAGEIGRAVELCNSSVHDSFLTRTFGPALVRCARSPFGFLELKSALEESGQQEVGRLQRWTDYLGLIATVAPMLGLLGTVFGILVAFDAISQTEGVPRPGELAGGISQALVTTVMGLIVAIPTTFAYTYLRNRIDDLAQDVARICEELAVHLEQAGGGSSQPPAGARPRPRPSPAEGARA
ncbi:MAG: MotA/TolQ/ExbB proton channel family protein [Phycisphaerales bacterium]|nr:MAG: MotA/TolQ/ExbB proton channel family protein [Phycisphaerales bacterium]